MKRIVQLSFSSLLISFFLASCGSNPNPDDNDSQSLTNNQGTLTLVANGEDFVRQGFTSKDGWRIDFNHVYISLAKAEAYQTQQPFNPEEDTQMKPKETVTLVASTTVVDLAQGDENAAPIVVAEVEAPEGIYNALNWQLTNNEAEGGSIILDGVASKDNQTINFVLSFSDNLSYTCGEFVGEERKGIVTPDKPGELETTLHFDHIFGDGEAPPDDELNAGAIGFNPLAALAKNGELQADSATLSQQLSPEDYGKLQEAIASLGHVGEGHCQKL